jgi:hydrogenase nickel incorporation protein HypB
MCDVCGCGDPAIVSEDLHHRILADNDRVAAHNRDHFARRGMLALNLMGSPGAGKTALLEATRRAAPDLRLAALSGDLATENDAKRLEAADVPARTITTGTACHLDAAMVHHALHDWPAASADVFVIENVGNLVCPADFPLGAERRVVVISTTEGDDTVRKHPLIFRDADVCVVNKVDLAGPVGVDVDVIERDFRTMNGHAPFIRTNAKTGEGVDALMDALLDQ